MQRGSFIPYNVRKAFQLPTFAHQDAIYAYLFYRLLHRARRVEFYYNNVSEFNVNGEPSRFLRQIMQESSHQVEQRLLANPVNITPRKPILIEKTPDVFRALHRFDPGGKDRISPSALLTYLQCRLKFYFRYVAKLYEPEELQENLDAAVFGNILHHAMEILYSQPIRKGEANVIYPQDLFWVKEKVNGAVKKAFEKHYQVDEFEFSGRNIIARQVIRKMMLQILEHDEKYAPFKIVGLELNSRDGYKMDLSVASGNTTVPVAMKGIIDRADLKEGVVRIMDYKTGRDEKQFKDVAELFERNNSKTKAVFQVFYYSYLFSKVYQGKYDRIEPGIFNSKELFNKEFDWRIYHKATQQPVTDFHPFLPEFESGLLELLGEIWDPAIPFDQVEDEKECRYCPYIRICHRDH
jgi:hypothetical protein